MKLYIYCGKCNNKVYLQSKAPTRSKLAAKWGQPFYITCPHCHTNLRCNVRQVSAEIDTDNTVPGAIMGGLVGLLAGPIGVLIGGVLGGATGHTTGDSDRQKVNKFNNS